MANDAARDAMLADKPAFGSPCNGCGFCCHEEVCGMGVECLGENVEAPCPLLRFDGKRFWCRVIEEADAVNPMFGDWMKFRLGIGHGCLVEDESALAARGRDPGTR